MQNTNTKNEVYLSKLPFPFNESVHPYVVTRSGVVYKANTGKILTKHYDHKGNICVTINTKNNKRLSVLLPYLLMVAFGPELPLDIVRQGYGVYGQENNNVLPPQVRHKNGNVADIELSNLEWSVPTIKPTIMSKETTIGEPNTIGYTSDTIHAICKAMVDNKSNKAISEELNIPRQIVREVRQGKVRNDITRQYVIPPETESIVPTSITDKIFKLLATGKYTPAVIAMKLDIPIQSVLKIDAGVHRNIVRFSSDPTLTPSMVRADNKLVHHICLLLKRGHTIEEVSSITNTYESDVFSIRNGDSKKFISRWYGDLNPKKENYTL